MARFMALTLFLVFCLINFAKTEDDPTNYYTIVAPKSIRSSDSEYHVAVTTLDAPCNLNIKILNDEKNKTVISKSVQIEKKSTKLVQLDITKSIIQPGIQYKLSVTGDCGNDDINDFEQLGIIKKELSVFIQTDKAIYKPSDTVNFRVLALDSNLKPSLNKNPVQVYITDGQRNRLKQWNNVTFTKGVFTGALELSSAPVLGNWKIMADFGSNIHEKQIEVAEYVLPKFDVTIDTPKDITFKDGRIRATIRSTYTYGKPVKGEATVSIYPEIYFGSIQTSINNMITRKVVPLDGKAQVEFDIKDELDKMNSYYSRQITIEAIVEEAFTGRKQNTTTKVNIHLHKNKMEFITRTYEYKPGLKYYTSIKVSHHDGSPVIDTNNQVTVEYQNIKNSYTLDSNGMINLVLNLTEDTNATNRYYDSAVSINAKYLELEASSYISKARSIAKSENDIKPYIQARVLTENPEIEKEVSVELTSTLPLEGLVIYQVAGRGDIILSKTITMGGETLYIFKFLASFLMVPKANLMVYYIDKNGYLISDQIEIKFQSKLQNFINIELSKPRTKPGMDIDLTITTKPNSFVGLMGVDQSVLLLKSGNDLSKDEIFDDLAMYDSNNADFNSRYGPFFRKKRRAYTGWNDWRDFSNIGLIILTNAKENREQNSSISETDTQYPLIKTNDLNEYTTIKTDIGPGHIFKVNTRPPLAGPYAFSRIPKPLWNRPRVYLTHDIENTWLFMSMTSGLEGKTTLRKKAPDTITSWVITGFSIDPVNGLGLIERPTKLETFQPFFVSINLPYSVKRGEVVSISIVVFNYMSQDVEAEVTLDNTGQEFEFTEVSNEINETPKLELYRRKRVQVAADNGKALSFMVRPKKVGQMTIKVTATSPLAGDAIERQLLVEPEGLAQYNNKAVLLDLRKVREDKQNITFEIPPNAVPDSTRIEVSVVGDILGPTVKNLDNLIRMPNGCGEQNMLNFVPNIVVMDYLTSIGKLTDTIKNKATKFMESGYQRELTYKHDDGSFSAFGNSDPSGSTWLTAFVARWFIQASKYISVEEKVIDHALQWLSNMQASNGSFPEVGKVSHTDMQGGSGQGIALTAFTVLPFLENPKYMKKYMNSVNKAVDYIVRNIEGLDDIYALAIGSYALQLAKHNAKEYVLQTLANKVTTSGDLKYWHKPIPKSDEKNPYYNQPNSVNVEMTAYGMLAYLEAGLTTDALPLMKWLIGQRNDQGGFQSTQDTVVGIFALSKLGSEIAIPNTNLEIVTSSGSEHHVTNVNNENAIVLQSVELLPSVREVNFTATGTGFAIVQVSYKYNMNVTGAWPRFTLDPQVNKVSTPDFLHLTVCTSYIPVGDEAASNMAVMEVSFPSGFTADLETLPSIQATQKVKKVETKDGDTVVIVYFDDLGPKEICPTFTAFKTHKVAKEKPAPVTVYDYYDNSRRARQFYQVKQSQLCDICEGEDCGNSCKIRAERSHQGSHATLFDEDKATDIFKSGSNTINFNLMTLFCVFLVRFFV